MLRPPCPGLCPTRIVSLSGGFRNPTLKNRKPAQAESGDTGYFSRHEKHLDDWLPLRVGGRIQPRGINE